MPADRLIGGLVARALRVVVVGAGIGGLAVAMALRQLGCEAVVCERAGELGEVGAGLQLWPNAVKVLRALGLEAALRPFASEPTHLVSLNWDNAGLRYREPLRDVIAAKFGAPYLTVHRADLHRLLYERLPAGAVRLGARCVDISWSEHGAAALFADGAVVEADVVIGADGIRSVVRERLFGPQPSRFSRQTAWRCLVPIEDVETALGPGGRVRIDRDEFVGWIGPNGHVICYPIRGGELYNIFAGRVSEDWAEESWTVPSNVDDLRASFAGWNDALLIMLGKVEDCYKWGIYDRDPLARWSRGRVTLLGDAAHPMMPTLAMGAAMTLEDAFVLARNLAYGSRRPENAIVAYESERIDRTRRVQLQARQQFENNRKVPPPRHLDRDWIFAHDATSHAMAS
jgi:salicylate hydroxylase